MKMFGRMMSCCVALLLTFSSVSAVRKLNSIADLRSVGFGQSVPEYSLRLLHWFATTVHFDNNNIILLTFDPNRGDYGSHRYRNDEELLDPLPRGYRYYTVGNIYQDASLELPDYVIEESNRARIIIRVRQQNAVQTIDQVYITQHYETYEDRGTDYDPQHTYRVTTCLLRVLRKFSLHLDNINSLALRNRVHDSQLSEIRNMWGDLACVGLLLFIVIPEKYSSHKRNNRRQPAPRNNTQSHVVVNIPESREHKAFVSPERYNSTLHSTSQDNNTCVCCFCVVGWLIMTMMILELVTWWCLDVKQRR
uniref:Immunoglobulin V-set domain-containing protein n=1 Tax=Oreochromis aureus TaxID=47969 RepID=A0A668TD54_OREAU